MSLPSIALHTHHNASVAVYHENDIVCVIEFERFVNKKNASGDFLNQFTQRIIFYKTYTNILKKSMVTKNMISLLWVKVTL